MASPQLECGLHLLQITDCEKEKRLFTVEKAGRLQLNHVIKVNTTSNKSRGHHVPPGMM